MITLPLLPSELNAAVRLPESEMSIDRWTASSEALPVDGVEVFCFVPCKQLRKREPEIIRMRIVDGHWIPSIWEWIPELYFPLEAVDWWMAIEPCPTEDDPRWISADVVPDLMKNGDVWVWNDKEKQVRMFWYEGKNNINYGLYYGSAGDPVLHDEHVTKWMPCVQPEHIEYHFMNRFPTNTWMSVRRPRPGWHEAIAHAAREGNARLNWRIKQLKLDLPRVSQ